MEVRFFRWNTVGSVTGFLRVECGGGYCVIFRARLRKRGSVRSVVFFGFFAFVIKCLY